MTKKYSGHKTGHLNKCILYIQIPYTFIYPMFVFVFSGHWVYYGYGMVCMYNQDYRTVGGFNKNIQGWGGEDVDLYIKHTKSNLNVSTANIYRHIISNLNH